MQKTTIILLAAVLALGAAACAGAKVYMTDGRPLDRAIAVDGRADDWVGVLCSVEDGRVKIGFINDRDSLYVCLMTDDESLVRRIRVGGFTVWFDPSGGQAKVLGIKYPLGVPKRQPAGKRAEEGGEPPAEPQGSTAEPGSAIEVIRAGGAPQRMAIEDVKGLEVKTSDEDRLFVYELKIPLQADQNSIGIGTQPGRTVGIGFDAPKPEGPKKPAGSGDGSEEGGRGMGGFGGRGGGPGGFGGGPGGMRGAGMGPKGNLEFPQAMKIWTIVKLSQAKTATAAEALVSR